MRLVIERHIIKSLKRGLLSKNMRLVHITQGYHREACIRAALTISEITVSVSKDFTFAYVVVPYYIL